MCRIIAGPDDKMNFVLFEINTKKASRIGCQPGFMYLPLPEKIKGQGLTQKQITDIVLWKNAKKGYLGINYHRWPLNKKIRAHLRIYLFMLMKIAKQPKKIFEAIKPKKTSIITAPN
jgi:hypothetical protein